MDISNDRASEQLTSRSDPSGTVIGTSSEQLTSTSEPDALEVVTTKDQAHDTSWDSNPIQHGDNDAFPTAYAEEDDDTELSALEYARCYGLSKNYLSEDPIKLCVTIPQPRMTLADLGDPERVVSVPDISVNELTRERIEAPAEALLLLQKVIKFDEQYNPLDTLPERPPMRNLRMELPLLRTDHETDILDFGRTPEPDFREARYPVEFVDVDKDEGIEWPQKYLELPEQKIGEIEKSKLECPMEAIRYLQDLIKDKTTEEELEEFYDIEPKYQKKTSEPMSPPILPLLSPPFMPFDPSSPTAQLPLLSESSGTLDEEADALEAQLQRQDRIQPKIFDSSDDPSLARTEDFVQAYSPLHSAMASDLSSSPSNKRKRDDLMVDVPLMLQDQTSSSPNKRSKSVSFAETLHEIIPALAPSKPPGQLDPDSEASLEAFFNDVIEPLAREATQAVEQEQLQEADSLNRVQVPVMDFSLLPPPWKTFTRSKTGSHAFSNMTELEAQRRLLNQVKDSELQLPDYCRWPTGNNMKLQWVPFPVELGKVPDNEVIDDSRYIAVIMSDMSLEDVVTSDQLVWKPEGLRIMHAYEDEDDDLEPAELEDEEEGKDVEGLVRKRRRAMEEMEHADEGQPTSKPIQLTVRSGDGHPKAQTVPIAATQSSPAMKYALEAQETSGLFGGRFSTATAISNFMNSMGQQNKRPRIEVTKPQTQPPNPIVPSIEAAEAVEEVEIAPPPVPITPPNLESRWFILSSSLYQNSRPLLRAIARLYSNAKFIERDFTSSLADVAPEADIILSPSTGLVITTLQKIRQKALPGSEKQITGIKGRVASIVGRYERLLVLVGDVGTGIDERDCEAMAEFGAFCAGFKTEIEIVFVPTGEEAMASWIIDAMNRYGIQSGDSQLLQDETLWEQFLRRAGLNAFAAQIILANLKDPPDSELPDNSSIRAFVHMSPDERMKKFESLLGGRRVLQKVNRILEMEWLSAKNGFRGVVA